MAFVYVFDLTRPATWEAIEAELQYFVERLPKAAVRIIGNKRDLIDEVQLRDFSRAVSWPPRLPQQRKDRRECRGIVHGTRSRHAVMNITALKNEIVARRHQLVVIDREGRLLASCDSIMPLTQHLGEDMLSMFFMFQGLEQTILQLKPGDPRIHLPMLAFPYEDKEYLLSLEIWAQSGVEGILWMMNQEDVPSERLRNIQQDRNEIHIGLEQMTEQEQTLREYTQQLEEAHQALQRFSYIVSHDLKAPLRTIGNLATWISEAFESGDLQELPQFIRLMHSRVQRMEGLIDGIFRYHRAGYEGQSQEAIDLESLLLEIQETLINPNHCQIHLPTDLPVLHSSRTALYQVFSNLLINGLQAQRPSRLPNRGAL